MRQHLEKKDIINPLATPKFQKSHTKLISQKHDVWGVLTRRFYS